MASSRSSDRVRTWEQIEGDFLQSCRILSLERRAWEDTAMWYHIGMNRTWGAGKVCLFADWKWEDASRFIGKGKEDFLFVWFWFFICIFFSYDVGQLVSVTYLWWCMALKYSLFYVVNLDSFSCICCETLFHTGQCIQRQFFKKFISTIYWMAYLIFFLKHPETCVFRPLCWERNLCILWGWNVFLTMKHEPG